ncbi:hypothetical protein MuYL_4097 [Mucilaginibacter xinganensis]|uniref:Uncharacterized protein n=1 Tax=Mucilaginibacter xinganensis TaxID=1234841 RepID=A0A223P1I9_9SPHI|nr:hypothetical protein MuYL_4097 [Mucilaginibacter xinganensis]
MRLPEANKLQYHIKISRFDNLCIPALRAPGFFLRNKPADY